MPRQLLLLALLSLVVAAGCASPTGRPAMGLEAAAPDGFGLLDNPTTTPCADQPFAVFAKSSLVDLTVAGSNNRIEGDVQTNCVFKLVGSRNVVTGAARTAQGYFIHGQELSASVGPKVPEAPFPFGVSTAGLTPTFTFDGSVNLNARPEVWQSPGVLKPGVYLSTGTISISGKGVSGKVTLIGAQVQLHGNDMSLEAFAQGLLAHATDAGQAIHLSGQGGHFLGLLNGPNGKVSVTGSGNTVEGAVLADVFEMQGSSNTITREDTGFCAAAPTTAETGIALTGLVSTFAGSLERVVPNCLPLTDGSRLATAFYRPSSISWDLAGNMLVADTKNSAVRRITPGGRVNTLTSSAMTAGFAFRPSGVKDMVMHRDGTIFFTNESRTIGKIAPNGAVSLFAGSNTNPVSEPDAFHKDGPVADARFYHPYGLAINQDTLYVSEADLGIIRKIDLTTNVVTTVAGAKVPTGTGNCVCMGYFPGYSDGQGTNGRFHGAGGIAVDRDGNLYITDPGNNAIRKMTPDFVVTTIAGDLGSRTCQTTACGPAAGLVDGPALQARFNQPQGLDLDAQGNLYVADTGNHVVRRIGTDGKVTTVAGDGQAGLVNGIGRQARFDAPTDVLVDPQGALYVVDQNNNAIRKIQ